MGWEVRLQWAGEGRGRAVRIAFAPFCDALGYAVAVADTGEDKAAELTAFLQRAARGVESIGYFVVEEVEGEFQLTVVASDALAGLYETPEGAA